jgi:putative PEP-CTERM system histidine kinase
MDAVVPWGPPVVALLAALVSSILGVAALAGRSRRRWTWPFGLGMLGFALESGAILALLSSAAEDPAARMFWLRAWQIAGLALLLPWSIFVARLGHPEGGSLPTRRRAVIAVAGALLTVTAGAVAILPAFVATDFAEPLYAAQLKDPALLSVIVQTVITVAILAGLEHCLRTTARVGRWRIKYLVLGLGGIFLTRFFFLSQILLFRVVLAGYLSAMAAILAAGTVVMALSFARDRGLGADLALSRQVFYRSALVAILGLYLLAVGGLGWLLNYFGVPLEAFWGSLIIFLSAIVLAAVMLSEHVRWRVRHFVARHFYASKYDFRALWERFTRRLSTRLGLDELGHEVLEIATDAAGSRRGALYAADESAGPYHLIASLEAEGAPPIVPRDIPLVARLQRGPHAIVLTAQEMGADDALGRLFGSGAAAAPLTWDRGLIGFMLIAPERTGQPYGPDDIEFFTAVAKQAAGAIVAARLSEAVARSREFEAFHHLTAFVIHDLKNSISSLSLLSQNALANFDDPEFQRDAIRTLSRTVERMKMLLARLAPTREGATLRFQSVDLAALALDATRPLDGSGRINLVKELAPVAPFPGDPDALLRVIQNLVANAVEAIAGPGTITVKTFAADGWAVCVVADSGRGMPQDFIRRSLFAPFRSTKKGGWGVGLYQAKGIVENHGGTIEVASQEKVGSTFTIRLPLTRAVPERPEA